VAVAKKRRHAKPKPKPKAPDAKKLPFHAFWSGALSFGLVNVPVLVFPASRHSGVRLRMISPDGEFLERRFYCPRDGKEVGSDEIVRGFELDDGSYIIVTDQELESIEPVKTRDIELREFVDLSEVAPAYMERGYYLTPGKGAAKAYRLLADVMEKTRRAGIATFVMRDREYLVAIFAKNGILCAETLRFHDEVRDPQMIGLAEPVVPTRQRVSAFERSVRALSARALSRESLADVDNQKLKTIIGKKIRAGTDVIRMNSRHSNSAAPEEDDVDLLDTIRRSLRHVDQRRATRSRPAKRSSNGKQSPRKTSRS
jgi:DNA end-binding protein Ku